jgi:hypothetical protein
VTPVPVEDKLRVGLGGVPETLRLPRGRGVLHDYVMPLATRIPPLRRAWPTVFRARFG